MSDNPDAKAALELGAVGNAAAMREALKRLLNLAYEVQDLNSEDGPKTSVPTQFIIDVTKSALSAPPRNCDAFSKAEVLEMLEDRSFSKEDTIEWLYSTATEQKGENDGE